MNSTTAEFPTPELSFPKLLTGFLGLILASVSHAQPAGRGVRLNTADASPGLTLIAPFGGQKRYVGFENYASLLTDPEYWHSLLLTLTFATGIVCTGIALAPSRSTMVLMPAKKSAPNRSILFIKAMRGTRYLSA